MSHPDPRPPAADGERALPEEIASAIEALINAIGYAASDDGLFLEDMNCEEARSTLTTSILSRLTAAEAGREELRAQIRTQAMEQLAADAGWELESDKLRAERDAALARVEKLETALGDPIAVHVNMLRGSIARPSIESIIHLYGVDAIRSALTEAQPKGDQ